MKKIIISFCIVPLLLILSCSSVKLTEEEATRLIREAKAYPMLISVTLYDIKPKTGLGLEINRLIEDGYLIPGNYSGHEITEKGKHLVQKCVWNSFWKKYEIFNPFTHKIDIKKISEILVDNDTKTAVVKYEIGVFPTEYFYKLIEIDRERIEKASKDSDKTLEVQIRLKKWDQGWRVEQ